MKIFCLISFCLGLSTICRAQFDSTSTTGIKVIKKVHELKNRKIDTIICHYVDCAGYIRPAFPNPCVAYDTKYLMWIDGNNSFIQRFDECSSYQPAKLKPTLFNLLRHNYIEIQNGNLKGAVYVDHYCSIQIDIYTANKILHKSIDEPLLEKQPYDDRINEFYTINTTSILNKLKTILEHEEVVYNKIKR